MNISKIINEECWELPDSSEKIKILATLLSKPLEFRRASSALYKLIGLSDFHDMLGSMSNKDPMGDSRKVILDYLSVGLPDIYKQLMSTDKSFENDHGVLSTVGSIQ